MHLEIIQAYYNQLASPETDVDNLWNNILQLYFWRNDNFGLVSVPQNRFGSAGVELDPLHQRIRAVEHLQQDSNDGEYVMSTKLIILSDKRVEFENDEDEWDDRREQLTRAMKATRALAKPETAESRKEVLYAISTIGRFSRFYELRPGVEDFVTHSSAGCGKYEFRLDEESIDAFLREIVGKISGS